MEATNPTVQSVYVFVGLGNPGLRYEMTRHNMGFLVIREFAARLGWSFKEEKRHQALVAKGFVEEVEIHIILPLTYMNLSGEAVKSYLDYYKLPVSALVVVTDDIALSFGVIRLKAMGSAGGHNGLKSIEFHLRTPEYKRLRMGIGHPGESRLTDYVLETFSAEEKKELASIVERGREVLHRLIKEDISRLMEAVNKSPLKKNNEDSKVITKPPLEG